MSFYDALEQWSGSRFNDCLADSGAREVKTALSRDTLAEEDFISLLSPSAEPFLEAMAQRVAGRRRAATAAAAGEQR